jgi:dGTPase
MVNDLLAETRNRLRGTGASTPDEVRRLGRPVAAFSTAMAANDRALKAFLFERMYRHERVLRRSDEARRAVADLFTRLFAEPGLLPAQWRLRAGDRDPARAARLVADYIAGMTDRFALDEHKRLCN